MRLTDASESSSVHFRPDLLVVSRQMAGLTQTELAGLMGVPQGKLSKFESGVLVPGNTEVALLSSLLDFPIGFFCRDDVEVTGLGVSELFHRKRQNVPSRVLARIHAMCNVQRWSLGRLLAMADVEDHRIPFIDLDEAMAEPEDVARRVRAIWNLPMGPIATMVGAIEHHGGVVFSFDFGTRLVDAISQFVPGLPPLFYVNSAIDSPDRLRFSLAHELGHIVMHQYGGSLASVEAEANRFASEFLMPEQEIVADLSRLDLSTLAMLKRRWMVSMRALIMRADALGRISARQKKSLFMELSRQGMQRREPDLGVEERSPRFLGELVTTLIEKLGYTLAQLAEVVMVSESRFREWFSPASRGLRLV